MTHLHFADGVLPWWVAAGSFALCGVVLAVVLLRLRPPASTVLLARAGVAGGAMLAGMALPLGPGVHLSLAPLAGILLGPGAGFVAAFLANGVLSLGGHGGLTAAGLNGLFLGLQATAAAGAFRLLRRPLGPGPAAGWASGLVLVAAGLGGMAAVDALPFDGHASHGSAAPCGDAHAGHAGHDGHGGHEGHEGHEGHDHGPAAATGIPGHGEGGWDWHLPVHGWGGVVVAALALGAALAEAWLTASAVGFVARVRGDLVGVVPGAASGARA